MKILAWMVSAGIVMMAGGCDQKKVASESEASRVPAVVQLGRCWNPSLFQEGSTVFGYGVLFLNIDGAHTLYPEACDNLGVVTELSDGRRNKILKGYDGKKWNGMTIVKIRFSAVVRKESNGSIFLELKDNEVLKYMSQPPEY